MRLETKDPVRAFAAAIARDFGANVDPIGDGELRRFDCPEGKRGNRACWYVLYLDRWPAGAYGNWRTGITEPWRADRSRDRDPKQRARIAAAIDAARRQGEREQPHARASAVRRAQRLRSDAKPTIVDHPYLARKRIPAQCPCWRRHSVNEQQNTPTLARHHSRDSALRAAT